MDTNVDEFVRAISSSARRRVVGGMIITGFLTGVAAGLLTTGWQHASDPVRDPFGDDRSRAASPDAGAQNERNDGTTTLYINTALPSDLPEPVRAVATQTVFIRTVDEAAKQFGYGSGFLLNTNLVVTATHVIADPPGRKIVVFCDGRERKAIVIRADPVRDVALLGAECDAKPLRLDMRPLDADTPLDVAGFNYFPGESRVARFVGTTSPIPGATMTERLDETLARQLEELRRFGITGAHHAVSGLFRPGNSGSPVFNEQGEVVGMLAAIDLRRNRSYMVTAKQLRTVIRAAGLQEPLPTRRK